MKYGLREICNVVFRAKNTMKIGNATFRKGQPVFFMDTAKTSSLEGAATTVYATGGRGNVRLVAWEGEKTVTMTVEDALLSPISFAMLSGAGVVKGAAGTANLVHAHQTTATTIDIPATGTYQSKKIVDLTNALHASDKVCETAPIFIMAVESDGSITGVTYEPASVSADGKVIVLDDSVAVTAGTNVLVDYYVLKNAAKVTELQIDAANFGGYFYVEADTLFRRQSDGADYPANFTIPNAKIQSNWTFSMASTGDPSTFTFTMDIMPGYTYFDQTKKVLAVIQVIEDANSADVTYESVMKHDASEAFEGEDGSVPSDNVPNTAAGWAELIGFTRVPKNATFSDSTTYYAYNSAATYAPSTTPGKGKFEADASVTSANFASKVATGLYLPNA